MNSADVSVVICTRNVVDDIGACITSIRQNHPKEILVVDGRSTDGTLDVLDAMGVRWISDEGRGLAYARRLGVENTTGELLLFVGPDNLLSENFVDDYVRLREEWGFDIAITSTRVLNPRNYWDKGMDFRWVCCAGTPGKAEVVGTPGLYERTIFSHAMFSTQDCGGADDTDFCEQLKGKGFQLGIVPLVLYEKAECTPRVIWNRFKFYGTGDNCFYARYRGGWTLRRRLKSLTHPLRQTVAYSKRALRSGNGKFIPWLLFAMAARYYGWATYKRRPDA